MKKNIFRFVTLVMAGALLFASCDQKDDPKKDRPQERDDKTGTLVPITLDGQFEDWDAITVENAKDNLFADIATSSVADDPIQVMKITADKDKIYFYIQWNSEGLPQNASCSEWGDSEHGTPEKGYEKPDADHPDDDSFRETVYLFIDPDGNDRTGFYTSEGDDEGEPAIPGLGCEMGVCWFAFYNYESKKVSMAWNQNNVGPWMTGTEERDEDGKFIGFNETGPFDYNGKIFMKDWPDSGENAALPLWGWLNYDDTGRGDNIAPSKANWFPAEAEGTVAKLEFAVEKKDITNLPADAEEFGCGIIVSWGAVEQCVGPLRLTYPTAE